MSYTYRYINRCAQFGDVNFTLLIEDLEAGKTHRIEKTFKAPAGDCAQAILDAEAEREIARITAEELVLNPQEEPETDGESR